MDKGKLAEEYTNFLAYRSYLRFWCYPNPSDEEGDKKEICDLLILFRDICLIISVKNYDFKGNYSRYETKVVYKSTKQLYGAERKLFKLDRKIIIKHPDKDQEEFDPDKFSKVFRLTVNMGEQFEYYSLGDQKKEKGFINIFNKETLEHLLQELDTIPDLVKYLEAREDLLTQHKEIHLVGKESDLLAVYMLNKRSFPEKYFGEHEILQLDLKQAWEDYDLKNIHVKDRREADKISYLIDNLVERDILVEDWGEKLSKELMSFNRLERRIIAQNFDQLISKYSDQPEIVARRHFVYDDLTLLLMKYPNNMQVTDKDMLVKNAGDIYFHKLGVKNKLIVLAAPPDLSESKYALLVKDGEADQRVKEYLDSLCEKFGWFKNMKETEVEYKEFPNEE